MNVKEIEAFTPDLYYYNIKDKAYNHVLFRVFRAYEEAENIRSRVNNREDFEAWQENIKKTFKASVGTLPYDRCHPLNARITGKIEEKDITIEKVIFEARERVYVTGNVYVPKGQEKRYPAVLLQCGHSLNGKASMAYQRAARIIAAAGIIVMVQDPPGQGERIYYKENGEKEPRIKGACAEHQQFGNPCFLTGSVPVKYFLADAMRGVDYLCSREDVDPERIGATGNSGGGALTSLIMLMDERIKAAAPSCWPTSGREYFVVGTAPDAEQIWPNILKGHLDHYEIMASMCPKPLLLLSQEGDFLPIEGTEKLFAECKRLWRLNESEENVEMHMTEGKHGYSESNARVAAQFFEKHLGAKQYISNSFATAKESSPITCLSEEATYCTESGCVMYDFPDNLSIFEENLQEYRSVVKNRASAEQIKKTLLEKVYYERKPISKFHVRKIESICEEDMQADMLLWFTQELMPCYGVRFQNITHAEHNLPVTICLWHGGTDRLEKHLQLLEELCEAGRQVLVLDVTAMGKCTPNRTLTWREPFGHLSSVSDKLCKALFTLGDSLCAIQAYDLIQTIKMVREKFGTDEVEVLTEGNYSILARIAEMLDDKVQVRALDEVKVADIVTEKYYETFDLAHILMPGLAWYLD